MERSVGRAVDDVRLQASVGAAAAEAIVYANVICCVWISDGASAEVSLASS